ncbi:MAG: hypothetical protein RH862_16775 [Leptospiraceae bacterium]
MKKFKARVKTLEAEGLAVSGGEPLIFHCNHYNLFLQRTIEDVSEYVDVETILRVGGVVAVHSMLHVLFRNHAELRNPVDRLKAAEGIYTQLGFGLLGFDSVSENGGTVQSPLTHYSHGWKEKWGKRDKPVDYFTCGFIQAAMAAAYYKAPGHFIVHQSKCLSMGDNENEFQIDVNPDCPVIPISPGTGVTIQTSNQPGRISTNVDEAGITSAVRGIPLEGGSDGLIPAFGVILTRHFANYYNYISYETTKQITEATGEPDLARDLFVEAGHVCAFNTFGGIMLSDEWYGMIEPQCKTREDWASGIVAVANAFGWGYWSISQLNPNESLQMNVEGDYESNHYLRTFALSAHPRSYLFTGGSAGVMNLLYHGDICAKPELTEDYYQELFQSDQSFQAQQTSCRTMGKELATADVKRMNAMP